MLRKSKDTAQSRSIMLNLSAPAGAALLRLLLVLCAASALLISSTSAIGVNFGQVANDLPANDVVLQLVQSTTIKKVKIYDANAGVLTTFAGTGIDFVIAADNDEIQPVANTAGYALQWVQTNVAAYPNTSIVGVALGNEVLSYEPQLIPFLVPALQNLQSALASLGLDSQVKVSTPNSLGIVAQSFPPSYGEFHYYSGNVMSPLLDFLAQTGAPFMVNIYPYFAYAAAPQNISLDYVLFSPSAVPVYDAGSGLNYTNMFDAQVDAVYAAISKLGYNNVTIAVTETGWPSAGDSDQIGADVANAQLYNANLVTHIESGVGTPAKPGVTVDTYIFALFNEDMKPGPTSERNFGLFNPDGTPVYNSGLTVSPEWYTPPSAYPPPPPVVVVPPVSDWPPPPVTSWPPPPVTVLPPVTSWSPPPPPIALPPTEVWSPPPPPIALPPTEGWSPPPPPIALPPTEVWSPPPPVYGGPQPPPVALPPPAVWSPPPVAYAPQPPPVYWPPPVVWTPPPVAYAPQPPPVYWPPPPPVVWTPPPVTAAPQPPPVGWSPPPPPVGWSPPPPVVIVTPPDGWSPPPPPVIVAPAWAPAYSPPPPWDPSTPSPDPTTPSPDPTTPSPDPTTPSPTVPVVPGPVGSKVPSWCVAKADADPGQLQIALDWACSTGGADCSLLQSGAACFTPNTLVAHASFAFDSYYQLQNRNSWDCFFSDTAVITTVNPSFAGCTYP